jgi:anaerobic ribonucleoside-triphosphate reductase
MYSKTYQGDKMNKEEILKKLQKERKKCIVYTRVMGYHRPVESFNIGKKAEHKQRKFFKES